MFHREIERDLYDLVLKVCDDTQCSDATILTQAPGFVFAELALSTSDGPLIAGYESDEEGNSSMLVWSCVDECETTVEAAVSKTRALGLDLAPGETPRIAYVEWNQPDPAAFDVIIAFCDDATCSTHTPVKVHAGTVGYTSLAGRSLGRLADGAPVLFFPAIGGWEVIVCNDPGCSQTIVQRQDGTWTDIGTTAPASAPSVVYAAGQQVRQLACGDEACSTISDTLLHTMDDADAQLEVDATYVGEKLILLTESLDKWPAEPDTEPADLRHIQLFTCGAGGCSPDPRPPVGHGNTATVATAGESKIAVLVQTGRAQLCSIFTETEECSDPNEALSQLTLYTTELSE